MYSLKVYELCLNQISMYMSTDYILWPLECQKKKKKGFFKLIIHFPKTEEVDYTLKSNTIISLINHSSILMFFFAQNRQ